MACEGVACEGAALEGVAGQGVAGQGLRDAARVPSWVTSPTILLARRPWPRWSPCSPDMPGQVSPDPSLSSDPLS